jgi:hypothetical protein
MATSTRYFVVGSSDSGDRDASLRESVTAQLSGALVEGCQTLTGCEDSEGSSEKHRSGAA